MKQLMKMIAAKIILAVLTFFMLCNLALAQNNGGSAVTTTHTETQHWYVQPWVWIVAGAVFVLILVALLRGGRSRDSVSVTKTTTESSDI